MESSETPNGSVTQPGEAGSGSPMGPARPARRSFLMGLVNAAAAGLTIIIAVPYVRFLLYPIFSKSSKKPWISLGPANQFSSVATPMSRLVSIKQEDGWLESSTKRPVYVTRDQRGQVEVLTAVCPHLGCTVQWSSAKNLFLCPCHGSVFAPDGAHLSGPSPRGMDSLPIKIQNGELLVRYQDYRQLLPVKEVVG